MPLVKYLSPGRNTTILPRRLKAIPSKGLAAMQAELLTTLFYNLFCA